MVEVLHSVGDVGDDDVYAVVEVACYGYFHGFSGVYCFGHF